jgi:hypothetical protein
MEHLTVQQVCRLLASQRLAGDAVQVGTLCRRISELCDLNGKDWVRQNRKALLDQWQCVLGLPVCSEKHFAIKPEEGTDTENPIHSHHRK